MKYAGRIVETHIMRLYVHYAGFTEETHDMRLYDFYYLSHHEGTQRSRKTQI